jgi:hypothetical protein
MKKIVLAICLFSSPVLAANQFNLVCDGIDIKAHNRPRHIVYTIDLNGKRFCVLDSERPDKTCKVRDIANVSEAFISFYDNSVNKDGTPYYIERVSRTDGKATIFGDSSNYDGTCEVAPFTGLPEKKF